MKNIFKTTIEKHMQWILTALIIAAIIAWLMFGCQVSNRSHSLKIHPHGYWTGHGYVRHDTLKPIVHK